MVEGIEWGGARGLAFDANGTSLACSGRHNHNGPATVLLYDWKIGKQTEKLASSLPQSRQNRRTYKNSFKKQIPVS